MRLQTLFPQYKGLGDQWRARILAAILSLTIPANLIIGIIFFLIKPGLTLEVILLLAGLVFQLSVFLVWRRFSLNAASSYMVIGSMVLCGLCIFYSGGIASVLLVGQTIVVLIAALLTSPRITFAAVAAMILFDFSLIYFGNSQRLANVVMNDTPIIRFALQTAILIILAGALTYSTRLLWILTENLVNSEYRFRALFEKTSDAVFITGLDLHLLEVNEQAARLLDYTPAELIGLPVRHLFPADEWAEVQQRFENVKVDGLPLATRRFLTKNGDELMLETNLSLVNDAVGMPLHYQSTGRDVTQKMREEQRIKSTLVHMTVKASTDSLTGILNRETILQHARAEWERYVRDGQPMSLLLIDMDELKMLNDTHGHLAGDQALNTVARVIEKHKRAYDWVGRYGGDEFLVVLPGATEPDAKATARRMRDAISRRQVKSGKTSIPIRFSVGVASTDGAATKVRSVTELVEMADKALYHSKRTNGSEEAVSE